MWNEDMGQCRVPQERPLLSYQRRITDETA